MQVGEQVEETVCVQVGMDACPQFETVAAPKPHRVGAP